MATSHSKRGLNSNSAARLKNHWQQKHDSLVHRVWENHADVLEPLKNAPPQMMAAALAALLVVSHSASQILSVQAATTDAPQQVVHSPEELVKQLSQVLPTTVDPLDPLAEDQVGRILGEYFHLPVSATLGGNRLNRSYGYIGKEQHLMRYPGDTMATHFDSPVDAAAHGAEGMAPGRGAWGYFAPSSAELTPELVNREKYYIAVQTFLAPGWGERTRELYAFFKHRRMLVVNPENGKAVVAVIGDAGPGASTGKHLGGSPEVMHYLERVDGAAKGPVLYYFIDDSAASTPLGPIQLL